MHLKQVKTYFVFKLFSLLNHVTNQNIKKKSAINPTTNMAKIAILSSLWSKFFFLSSLLFFPVCSKSKKMVIFLEFSNNKDANK